MVVAGVRSEVHVDRNRQGFADYSYIAGVVALLTTGLLLRSWGLFGDTLDLWADEAWWATNLVTRDLTDLGTRPIGYMMVSRLMLGLTNHELALRLPSYAASVGTMLCVVTAASLLFRSRSAVLFGAFTVALHPKLITFAKEFKPYSVETFVYAGLILWTIICCRRGRTGPWFWVAAAVALLFSYNVVFLYPAIAFALAGDRIRGTAATLVNRLRTLAGREKILLAFAVLAAAALLQTMIFDMSGAARRRLFWGDKYGVFPIDTGITGGIAWYVAGTWSLLAMPGAMHTVVAPLAAPMRILVGLACVTGVVALAARQRYPVAALLAGPLLVMACANLLGYWPYGAFRTNLFLMPGLVLATCAAVDWLAERQRSVAYVAVVAFALASAPIQPGYHRVKHLGDWAPSPQLTEVLRRVQMRYRGGTGTEANVILADWHSWHPIRYYTIVDPDGRRDFADLRENLQLIQGPLNELGILERQLSAIHRTALAEGRPARVWIVVTKLQELGDIRVNPLVEQFAVYQEDFATHDVDYHPVLLELLFPRSAPAAAVP